MNDVPPDPNPDDIPYPNPGDRVCKHSWRILADLTHFSLIRCVKCGATKS